MRLRWRSVKPAGREYKCFVYILDREGKLIGQLDHSLAAANPSVLIWRPGDVALENLWFSADHNGGAYRLRVGLFDPQTEERLPARIVSGGPGFSLTDGETAVLTPEAPGPM